MPRVLNKYSDNIPAAAIFIGRPSKYGNPFIIGKHGTREEVIAMYRTWLTPELIEEMREELRGRDLVCYCAPRPCHGDVLLELLREDEAPDIPLLQF